MAQFKQQFCCVCGGAIGNRGEMGYRVGELDILYCGECYFSKEEFAIIHGVNCEKVLHMGTGYLHGQQDDTIYDVDGITYCGRCHTFF